MFALSSARSLTLACVFAGVAASAHAQVLTARFDGFDTGWMNPTGGFFIPLNGPATDVVRSGTGTTSLGCDLLNLTLVDAYQPVALDAAGTTVANLSYTNTATTGGGIEAVTYRVNFDLYADGLLGAADIDFELNLEFSRDAATGVDSVRRVGGPLVQLATLGGQTFLLNLSVADAGNGFLTVANQWYSLAESGYDTATGAAAWSRGLAQLQLGYAPTYSANTRTVITTAVAPAAVPEPAAFGWAGAAALAALTIFRRRQRASRRD